MERSKQIKAINTTIEVFSDKQLEIFVSMFRGYLKSEEFKNASESTPYVGWGKDTSTYEDNWGWANDNKKYD